MPFNLGDWPVDGTLYVPFATFDSNGASVTITGLAVTDIEIYKDGGTTQRASDSGYALLDTDGIDFDGATGIHGFSIDLSDNSDAGFYAAGSTYWIVVNAITVDSQTVRFVYLFTIGKLLRPTTAGRTLDVTATGEAGLDLDNTSGTLDAAQLGADCITAAKIADGAFVAANFAASSLDGKGDWNTATPLDAAGVRSAVGLASANLDTQIAGLPTAAEVVNEWETQSQADPTGFHVNVKEVNGTAQTANDNGADINAILVDTGTTIPAAIATAQADLDLLTGADGATLATLQANYAPAKAGDGMGLADDAITSAKFDETTAFPLKSADAASTQVARTGADGDTLETLSDQIDLVVGGEAVNVVVKDRDITIK